jgi:hypothetical protein
MCEQSIDPIIQNCVHSVEVTLRLAAPYSDGVFEIQRPNCGKQVFVFDDEFVGTARGDESGIGIRWNLEFSLEKLTPGKPHALVITASENDIGKCAPGIQIINITGLAIRAVPLSN